MGSCWLYFLVLEKTQRPSFDQNTLKLMLPSRMMMTMEMMWNLKVTRSSCPLLRWSRTGGSTGISPAKNLRRWTELSVVMPFPYVINAMRAYFFDPKPKNKSILWKDYLEPINPEEGEWDTGEGEKAKNNDNRSDRRVVLLLMMMVMLMMTMIMLTLMRTLTMPSWCI